MGVFFWAFTTFLVLQFEGRRPLDFEIKKSAVQDRVIISALDAGHETDPSTRGSYLFSINGLQETLHFKNGICLFPHVITHSSFLFLREESPQRTAPKVYFLFKMGTFLIPFYVPIVWLLVIPLCLFLFSFIFKRLLMVILIFFVLFFIFNRGLNIQDYFTLIKDWISAKLSH